MRNEVLGEPPPKVPLVRHAVGTGKAAVFLLIWENRIQIMLPDDDDPAVVEASSRNYDQAFVWLREHHTRFNPYHEYLSDVWDHSGYTTVTIWRSPG